MKQEKLNIEYIPAIIWGEPSDKVYLSVHGSKSCKEEAEGISKFACAKGYQVLSFDLPEHGERKDIKDYPCDVFHGMKDLAVVMEYVQKRWNHVSLFACSLGAYFSLMTYQNVRFEQCLLLSPILDMERLIENMMTWFQVTKEELQEKKVIDTPMGEKLVWDIYTFVKENPINKWDCQTYILYGSQDNLTELSVLKTFAEKYNVIVDILEGGEHWFHTEEQVNYLEKWLDNSLK